MRNPYRFIVEPFSGKYRTTKEVAGKTLFLTSSIEDAKFVSRIAIVTSVPLFYKGEIEAGDIVVIHHNIFREFYNHNGKVANSPNYINYEGRDLFLVNPDLIYLYSKGEKWEANEDYCFIRPIKEIDKWSKTERLVELKGEVVYSNTVEVGKIIGFTPHSEYEFEIDEETLYRMKDSDICLYYEGT